MAVVLNTQITLSPGNQIAHIADWTGLVVGTGYIVSGSFLQPDTRFTFQGFADIVLSRQPLSVPQANTEVPATISTLPQPAVAPLAPAYPFNTKDRLVGAYLNNAFEFNASVIPPVGNGGGAGMYNQWIDNSPWPWPNPPGGTVEILRQCIVPQATPGAFVDAEWITLGFIHRAQRRFWFNGNNVGFVNGLTIGSGGLVITDPNAQMPFVRLTGDTMTGDLTTPGLHVVRHNPGGAAQVSIANTAGEANSVAQLTLATPSPGSSISFHIYQGSPTITIQMGTSINAFTVWRSSPDVRAVGGFNDAGWSLGLDGRYAAGNNTDFGMLASGDNVAAILCGRFGFNNYYRTSNHHNFENRDGGQLWAYIDSAGLTTPYLRVNAAWFELQGIKYAERGLGSPYTTLHDSSGTMIGHTNSNTGQTTQFNWSHLFVNRNNTTAYAEINANGLYAYNHTESQFFVASRAYGPNPGYRFTDRSTTFTFDTGPVVPYFEWFARDNKAQLFWSIDGTVRFQFDYSGQFTLNGINIYNNAGWLQIANAGLRVAGEFYCAGTIDLGMGRDANNDRFVKFRGDSFWFQFQDSTNALYWQTGSGINFVWRWNDGVSLSARGPGAGMGDYINASDRRFKDEASITPATAGLAEILQLQPVEFQRLTPKGMAAAPAPELGFVAQDVAPVIPRAVRIMGVELPDGTGGLDDPEPTLGLTLGAIVAAMANAFKTIDDRLKLLEGA